MTLNTLDTIWIREIRIEFSSFFFSALLARLRALSPLTRDCKFPNIVSAYASMKKDDVVHHRVPGKLVAISYPEKTGELRM